MVDIDNLYYIYYNKDMEHLFLSAPQRLLSKMVDIYKRQQKKPKFGTTVAQRNGVIIASVLCGLLLTYFHVFPISKTEVPLPPASITNHPKVDPNANAKVVTQDNPLFASRPSWIQSFENQTSGLPDPTYWNVLVGPAENSNKEQQYYTDNFANLRIENGALRLIATQGPQPQGYKYGSARLETQGKQSFLYGRIDITAKLPKGVGTWPAVWLLPANDVYAKKSPAGDAFRYRNGGEIDIIEAVGHEPGVMYGITHTLADATRKSDGTGSYDTLKVPTASTDFNKYTLLWTPTTITFAVNDKAYYTYERQKGADYKSWPFDQPFYMIANLAMGGTWGGMDTAHFPGNGIDNKALPASLDIRSIYYYPYVGSMAVK